MKNFILATSILLLGSLTLPGQDSYLSKRIIEEINNDYSSYESLYKYLHENPELSHQEKETSQLIKRKLQSFGYEITDSLGGYGFAGILHNGAGPVIMYRTDMDALPIKEQTGLPYASSKTAILEGDETAVMHACGHDMHMTVFTGTAESMLKLKDHWKGTLLLLAQPAEERGGAQILLKNDLFSRIPIPDIALAFHVAPDLETGKIGYCPGPAYASVGTIDMTVYGQGGHGA